MDDKQHITALVTQGWEISGFSSAYSSSGSLVHTALLKKNRQHKIVVMKKRPILGLSVEEIDV